MVEQRQATVDGCIPFRIRIGVTGHRDMAPSPRLVEAVQNEVRRIHRLLAPPHTEVRLSVVSQLAEGGDRLVAEQVLEVGRESGREAGLEVILPLERRRYVKSQKFGHESREQFDRLCTEATTLREPPDVIGETPAEEAAAFEAAGRRVVGRSDVLIALWSGRESGGKGGTAETLLYAASCSKPSIWILTEGAPIVRDNLMPERVEPFFREVVERAMPGTVAVPVYGQTPDEAMASLRGSCGELDEFNAEALAIGGTDQPDEELAPGPGAVGWVAPTFARASALAARWQWRFKWAARSITTLAALAAAMLALSLSFGRESPAWTWMEAALFGLALLALLVVRMVGFRRRWLSYRVLAERLRSAYFLAPTGADFSRQARFEAVYAGDRSTAWLMRAFEEVWDRRDSRRSPADLDEETQNRLKRWLADDWIGEQIAYHKAKSRHHRRWQRALTWSVGALFVATIAFACLHSVHVWEDLSVFFSIVLPAVGASLGVLLTVNQHHALSERYARMRSDLTVSRRQVLDARPDSIGSVSSHAAQVMAQETDAWFGSMWFLDIEHP